MRGERVIVGMGSVCAVVNEHTQAPRIDITQNPQDRRRRNLCHDTLHLTKTEWRGQGGYSGTGRLQMRASVASTPQVDTGMVTIANNAIYLGKA